MINDYRKPLGADDPFNKAKIAKEAEIERKKVEEIRKRKEQDSLQLKINNIKHELVPLISNIKIKETKFFGAKRDIDATRRKLTLEEIELRKKESTTNTNQNLSILNDLRKLEQKLKSLKEEQDSLERELTRNKNDQVRTNQEIQRINKTKKETETDEIFKLNKSIDLLKKELANRENEISKIEAEITKTKKEVQGKEDEIKKLEKQIKEIK